MIEINNFENLPQIKTKIQLKAKILQDYFYNCASFRIMYSLSPDINIKKKKDENYIIYTNLNHTCYLITCEIDKLKISTYNIIIPINLKYAFKFCYYTSGILTTIGFMNYQKNSTTFEIDIQCKESVDNFFNTILVETGIDLKNFFLKIKDAITAQFLLFAL